ncbi:unnamed protein product, partial [Phaeothamnion confervicola]
QWQDSEPDYNLVPRSGGGNRGGGAGGGGGGHSSGGRGSGGNGGRGMPTAYDGPAPGTPPLQSQQQPYGGVTPPSMLPSGGSAASPVGAFGPFWGNPAHSPPQAPSSPPLMPWSPTGGFGAGCGLCSSGDRFDSSFVGGGGGGRWPSGDGFGNGVFGVGGANGGFVDGGGANGRLGSGGGGGADGSGTGFGGGGRGDGGSGMFDDGRRPFIDDGGGYGGGSGAGASNAEWPAAEPLSDESASEVEERRRWHEWAIHAAEAERRRRMDQLRQIEMEETAERAARRAWALSALEEEQRRRVSQQFLTAVANTQWFSETISNFCGEYEVICPYSQLGCRHCCLRADLASHLADECAFAREDGSGSYGPHRVGDGVKSHGLAGAGAGAAEDAGGTSSGIGGSSGAGSGDGYALYEVVCPNAVLGCRHSCARGSLATHLAGCPFGGLSETELLQERRRSLELVKEAAERERERRVAAEESGEWRRDAQARRARRFLHRLVQSQVRKGVLLLHDEILSFVDRSRELERLRRPALQGLVAAVTMAVRRLWHSATVVPYGSVASGLATFDSDVDLVVCLPPDGPDSGGSNGCGSGSGSGKGGGGGGSGGNNGTHRGQCGQAGGGGSGFATTRGYDDGFGGHGSYGRAGGGGGYGSGYTNGCGPGNGDLISPPSFAHEQQHRRHSQGPPRSPWDNETSAVAAGYANGGSAVAAIDRRQSCSSSSPQRQQATSRCWGAGNEAAASRSAFWPLDPGDSTKGCRHCGGSIEGGGGGGSLSPLHRSTCRCGVHSAGSSDAGGSLLSPVTLSPSSRGAGRVFAGGSGGGGSVAIGCFSPPLQGRSPSHSPQPPLQMPTNGVGGNGGAAGNGGSASRTRIEALAEQLRRQCSGCITVQKVLLTSRVPIIKAVATFGGFHFALDLSIDGPGHSGLATTAFVRYAAAHLPDLAPLTLVLKHFLQRRRLNDPYRGGVGSYALVLMVTFLLLRRHRERRQAA